jgi:ribosomal 50S subunit-recycling heat shock protein
LRIDVYLKLIGVFKTRSAAGRALAGGFVSSGGNRLKSSYAVREDDVIRVVRDDGSVWTIQVLKVPEGKQVSRRDREKYFRTIDLERD